VDTTLRLEFENIPSSFPEFYHAPSNYIQTGGYSAWISGFRAVHTPSTPGPHL